MRSAKVPRLFVRIRFHFGHLSLVTGHSPETNDHPLTNDK
jgi:hypothetical protein